MLALRNLRQGRGDRRGAMRLAAFFLAVRFLVWVFESHHVPTAGGELGNLLFVGLESAIFWAVLGGMLYLALEPVLRRRWPERLIGWTRLLAGDFRDPLVGRDILAGTVAGVAVILAIQLSLLLPQWLGRTPGIPALWVGLSNLGL